MANRAIDRSPGAAAAYTGSQAGIGVDSDDNKTYVNPNGTRRALVDTEGDFTVNGDITFTGSVSGAASDNLKKAALGILIDGNGVAITPGVKGSIRIPFACTITGWTILSVDATPTSGSIVIDVWNDVLANYPPTVLDTITAAAKPTLTTATAASSSTLTGWDTTVAADDILTFNVDSITSVTRILLELYVTKT